MDPIETAHKLIIDHQFDKLDDIWTEMIIDGKQKIEDLLGVAAELKKLKETDHARLLLEMLAAQYEQEKMFHQSIEVHKTMLYYHADEKKTRARLIELYHRAFPDDINLEDYLELSGMSTDEPTIKALNKLDEFLDFRVGQQFYSDKHGLGRVVEAMPEKREIIIDFEKAKRFFIKIDVARGLLMPVSREHFLALKHANPDRLKAMLKQDPVSLAKKIIMDWQEPLTASGIKNLLEDLLPKQDIDNFWDRVKRDIDKDPEIKTQGRSTRTYRYIADAKAENQAIIKRFQKARPQEKYGMAQDIARHTPELLSEIMPDLKTLGNGLSEKDPATAMHVLLFAQEQNDTGGLDYSPDSLLDAIEPSELLNEMSQIEHQKIVIDILRNKYGDHWVSHFKKLFMKIRDASVLDYVNDLLDRESASDPAIYQQILTLPKNYPDQYKWLLRKMTDGSYREQLVPALVPRIIQSADFIKGTKQTVQKLLDLETFDNIVKNSSPEDVLRIYNALMTSVIDGPHKKALLRIIEHHDKNIKQEPEDKIYTTENSLKKRQAELKHLLDVEIPANKKDIGRAREHGDLSENFEYKAAKEKQDQLYSKVRLIEEELKKVKLIKTEQIVIESVSIGTKIQLKDTNSQDVIQYTILGRWDTDLNNNVIANEAPIAVRLIGKKIGDEIEINNVNYRISKIEKAL